MDLKEQNIKEQAENMYYALKYGDLSTLVTLLQGASFLLFQIFVIAGDWSRDSEIFLSPTTAILVTAFILIGIFLGYLQNCVRYYEVINKTERLASSYQLRTLLGWRFSLTLLFNFFVICSWLGLFLFVINTKTNILISDFSFLIVGAYGISDFLLWHQVFKKKILRTSGVKTIVPFD